jgi:hypothetical protein
MSARFRGRSRRNLLFRLGPAAPRAPTLELIPLSSSVPWAVSWRVHLESLFGLSRYMSVSIQWLGTRHSKPAKGGQILLSWLTVNGRAHARRGPALRLNEAERVLTLRLGIMAFLCRENLTKTTISVLPHRAVHSFRTGGQGRRGSPAVVFEQLVAKPQGRLEPEEAS